MDNSSYALVLTGAVRPGHAPETVWPALATYFRMDEGKLDQLRARAPLAIKQGDDLGKLQTLQAGIAAAGAQAELCAPDGRPALFVLLDRAPRGPVPRVYVEECVGHGLWPGDLNVAEVGSNAWAPYRDYAAPAPPEPQPAFAAAEAVEPAPPRPSAPFAPSAGPPDPAAAAPLPLPPGPAIHAGFWRRCAAAVLDGFLIGVAVMLLQAALGLGLPEPLPAQPLEALLGGMLLAVLVALAAQWLYFAAFESAAVQATPGKLALGLKVVDDGGRRIGFARASGRYFGKILSGLVLNVGYLLAGWTGRKQALHDLLAGTLVVFRGVDADRPLPIERPSMPWYGWVLNMVVVGACLLAALAVFLIGGSLDQLTASAVRGGYGF